jgi:hypothetical protein
VFWGTASTGVESGKRAEREQKPGKHDRERVTAHASLSRLIQAETLHKPTLHDVVVREKASYGRRGPGRGAGRTRFAVRRLLMPSLSGCTSVKVSPAIRISPVVRGLPVALDVSGVWEDLARPSAHAGCAHGQVSTGAPRLTPMSDAVTEQH